MNRLKTLTQALALSALCLLAPAAQALDDTWYLGFKQASFANGGPKSVTRQIFYSMGHRAGDLDTDVVDVPGSAEYPASVKKLRVLPGAAQYFFVIEPDGSEKTFEWSFAGKSFTLRQGRIFYKDPGCVLDQDTQLDFDGAQLSAHSGQKNCAGFGSGARVAFDAPPDFPYGNLKDGVGRCTRTDELLSRGKRACQSSIMRDLKTQIKTKWPEPGQAGYVSPRPAYLGREDNAPFNYCANENWPDWNWYAGLNWNPYHLWDFPNGVIHDGYIHDDFGFTTNDDGNEWWFVDLGGSQQIASIKIWNRHYCCPERSAGLLIELSDDAGDWILADIDSPARTCLNGIYFDKCTVYFIDPSTRAPTPSPTETQLQSETKVPVSARYVRLRQPNKNHLTLKRVEVYGCAAD